MYSGRVRLELKGHICFSTRDIRAILIRLCVSESLASAVTVCDLFYVFENIWWLPPPCPTAAMVGALDTEGFSSLWPQHPTLHTSPRNPCCFSWNFIWCFTGNWHQVGGVVPSRPGWQGPSSGKGQRLRQRGVRHPGSRWKSNLGPWFFFGFFSKAAFGTQTPLIGWSFDWCWVSKHPPPRRGPWRTKVVSEMNGSFFFPPLTLFKKSYFVMKVSVFAHCRK